MTRIDIKSDSVPPIIVVWTRDNATIAEAVRLAHQSVGLEVCTITGGMEGIHSGDKGDSKHYHCMALDFRTREWGDKTKEILTSVAMYLGFASGARTRQEGKEIKYQFIYESDHLHVERVL